MAQKVFFTRKTSLTFLFLLFLRNLNICCICCDCCYDDLLQKGYSFILDDDSKEKYKDDVSLRTEKWKEKNKEEFDIKSEIKRSFSFDKSKKNNSHIKKNESKEEDIITQYSEIWKIFLGKKIYEYLTAKNVNELDIKEWKNIRNMGSAIEAYFEFYREDLKNFVRFGLMIDPQIALETIQGIVPNGELVRMFNAVLNLYDLYFKFEKQQKGPSIKKAFDMIEENWVKGKKYENLFEKKYKKFEDEILNTLMKHKGILCERFWLRRNGVLNDFLSNKFNENYLSMFMEEFTFKNLFDVICSIPGNVPSKNEIENSIKKIIISETFYKNFFRKMYEPLNTFFEKKQEEEKKKVDKEGDKEKKEEKKEEEKEENKKEEEKKKKEIKTLCEVGDLKLRIEKNEEKIYLDNFIVCLLTFKEDFITIFENNNKKWLKWLKEKYYIVKNNPINKKSVFSEIVKEGGSFNGNSSDFDKYFCSMLCLLYEFLKADSDDVFGKRFKELRQEIVNFFCQKKKIWGIESEFDILPEDFYDTFFGFMATMYQKFLGRKPLEEELPKVSLKEEEEKEKEKKEDKEEKKEEEEKKKEKKGEQKGEKKDEKKEEFTVDFEKAIESLQKEENLIKKTFGFYYIVNENDSFKLKHKFCCKVPDDYKNEVTFKDLLALYKDHKKIIRFFPQKNLILIVTCQESSSGKSKKISANSDSFQIENNKYCLKTILNPVVIKTYSKSRKKMEKGSSIFSQKNKDSSSGPSLTSPYDSLYKDITNIDKNRVRSLSCLWGKHISYFLSQEEESALLKNNISSIIEKIRDFYIGEKIDEFFAENEKPENKNNEKLENKNEENIEFKSVKECLMFLKEHLTKGNNVPVPKTKNIDPYFKPEFYDKIKKLSVENDDFLDELKKTIKNCLNFKENLEEKDIDVNKKTENNDNIFFFIYTLAEFLHKKVLALKWEEKKAFLGKHDKNGALTEVLFDMNEKKNIFSGFFDRNGINFESLYDNKRWENLLNYNFFEKICSNSPFSKLVNSWNNYYENFSSNLKSFLINFVTSEVCSIFGWKTLPGKLYSLTKKNSETALKQILSEIKKKTDENKSNLDPKREIEEIKNIIKDIEGEKKEIEAFLEKLKSCYNELDPKKNQFFPISRYYVEEYEKNFSDLVSLFEKYNTPFSVFIENKQENFIGLFFSVFHDAFCDMKEKFKNIPVSYNIDNFESYSNGVINSALVVKGDDEISSVIKKLKSLRNIFLKTFVKEFVDKKEYEEKFKEEEKEEEKKDEEKKDEEKKDEELNNGLKYKGFDIRSFIENLFFSFFPNVEKINESTFPKYDPNFFINKVNAENKLGKIAHNDAFFGINNGKNNCFLNALMQCLFKLSDVFVEITGEKNDYDVKFFEFLKDKEKAADNEEANSTRFILKFLELIIMVHNKKKEYEEKNGPLENNFATFSSDVNNLAEIVKEEWRKVIKCPGSTQGDPEEAFGGLFNCLNELSNEFKGTLDSPSWTVEDGWLYRYEGDGKRVETNCQVHLEDINDKNFENNFCEKNKDFFDYLEKNLSTIYKRLGILQLTELQCSKCNLKKFSFNGERCFRFLGKIFDKEEELVDNYCVACKRNVDHKKITRLLPIGKYLIVQNKTVFDYLSKVGSGKKPIVYLTNFEDNPLYFGKNKFKNFAVEIHSGTLEFGHYWAWVKSAYNKDYYFKCNDSDDPYNTRPIKYLYQDMSNQQYLYFFEKIEEQNENLN